MTRQFKFLSFAVGGEGHAHRWLSQPPIIVTELRASRRFSLTQFLLWVGAIMLSAGMLRAAFTSASLVYYIAGACLLVLSIAVAVIYLQRIWRGTIPLIGTVCAILCVLSLLVPAIR